MFEVMLAKPFFHPTKKDEEGNPIPVVDPTGWLMSEKLDGVRAYWDGTRFWSRGKKVYQAPDWFTENLPTDFHLDGELWMGRGEFHKASGIARKKEPHDGWADLTFLVFDAPKAEGGFESRLDEAREMIGKQTYARVVDHEVCEGMEHLMEHMKQIIQQKGEGVMLRESGSPYIRKRTKHLLKVKKFKHGEAMIVGYQAGEGKHEGRMGALLVYWIPPNSKTNETVTFKIGTGFTDEQRENPDKVGQVVKFAYFEIEDSGAPRFPVYVGLRE